MLKQTTPRIIPKTEHGIRKANISANAMNVLTRLKQAGFTAYLVGGGVRDLLLDVVPKDFDIATDAEPEEIKKIFRGNCLLIGRRFRLAHIRCRQEIIEVATFRADHSKAEEGEALSKGGLILRDNVYGTIEEDAFRRDFTLNALYYDMQTQTVTDYIQGVEDIQNKIIRIIGDPDTRYQEDPVRMLRAIRFAGKLDFEIEEKTRNAISTLNYLLHQVSPARLFEEVLKLFLKGHAEKTFSLLLKYDLFKMLFPASSYLMAHPGPYPVEKFLTLAMHNSDARVQEEKSLNPGFIYAVLLWYPFLKEREHHSDLEAAHKVLKDQRHITTIPKRFAHTIIEILTLQGRFEKFTKRSVSTMLSHPRFRAAYDFLLLRQEAGEPVESIVNWWESFQQSDEEVKEAILNNLLKQPRKKEPPLHQLKTA